MANLGAGRAKDPLLKANDLLPGLFIMSDSRALPGASSANVAFWLSVCFLIHHVAHIVKPLCQNRHENEFCFSSAGFFCMCLFPAYLLLCMLIFYACLYSMLAYIPRRFKYHMLLFEVCSYSLWIYNEIKVKVIIEYVLSKQRSVNY